MKNRPQKSSLVAPLLIVGMAVLLFGGASLAHILDKRPDLAAASAPILPLATPDGQGRVVAKRRCSECGVIESMRDMETGTQMAGRDTPPHLGVDADKSGVKAPRRLELTLRMNNGERHLIPNAAAGAWKVGERVFAFASSSQEIGTTPQVMTANAAPTR